MSSTNFPHSEAPAPSTPSQWCGHDLRAHVVHFYGEDSYLLDGLSRFIGTALGAGDGALVIATKAHRDGLTQRLKIRGVDPVRAIEQGRYIVLDAAETLSKFMRDGWPDTDRFVEVVGSTLSQVSAAAEGQPPRVAAFGEMVALLWEQGKVEQAIRLEQLWNDLAQTHSFSLHCAYPMTQFDREEHGGSFLKICAAHGEVIPGESYTVLSNEDERLRNIAYLQQKAQALTNEIIERRQVEDQLRRSKAELESLVEERTVALRQLSARLLTLQDSERRRIARELHDCLGQYLVGLKLNVNMLRQAPEREELWVESEELMQQCVAEVRTLSYLLHPPTMDVAGFDSAARWYVEGFSQRSGIKVTLNAPDDLARLPDVIELTLFRVMQEALTNVHRHSGGTAAEILIQRSPEQVILEIKDNGCGINRDSLARFRDTGAGMGVGLTGMRERVRDLGGKLRIDSDDHGTSIRITIPVTPDWVTEMPRPELTVTT
jgi:signal transduction histidine kinase